MMINPCSEIILIDSFDRDRGEITLMRTVLQDDGTTWYCLFTDSDVIQWIKSSYSTSDYVYVGENPNVVTASEKVYVIAQLKWEVS